MQASPLEVRPIADLTRPVAGAGRPTTRAGCTPTAAGPAKRGVLELSARERVTRCRDRVCTSSATRPGQGWDRRLCQPTADLSLTIGRQPDGHRWRMESWKPVPDRVGTSSATRLGQHWDRRLCQPAADFSFTIGRQPAGHRWSMGSREFVPGGDARRHGLPGSHGPSRMGLKDQKVSFRLGPQHGSALLQHAAAALVLKPACRRARSLSWDLPVRTGTRHGARGRG
jgi:hypothetical protein